MSATNTGQPTMADLQEAADKAASATPNMFSAAIGGAKLGIVIGTVIGTGVIVSGAAHALSRFVFGNR